MARFDIFKDVAAGTYQWRFQANNNEIVAQSEGYNSKAAAQYSIRVIQQQAAAATVIDEAGY